MSGSARFERISAALASGVRNSDGLLGLVLLGSASDAGQHRRDEWSDHDFFVVAAPGRGGDARSALDWLPDPGRAVLTAREGDIGFVVVYDDGHVLEFALAEATELHDVSAGDATVVVDDAEQTTASLIVKAQETAAQADSFDPANEVRLALVKILLGVGRVRRGELLNGGQFVRTWAVKHLLRAVRGHFPGQTPHLRDTIDPTRRFEADYPILARSIAEALDSPVEEAARRLFDLIRRIFESEVDWFPTAAADAIARRLGWPTSSADLPAGR